MVITPARRLALAAVATTSALALLFSYRTSTSPTPPVAMISAAVPSIDRRVGYDNRVVAGHDVRRALSDRHDLERRDTPRCR